MESKLNNRINRVVDRMAFLTPNTERLEGFRARIVRTGRRSAPWLPLSCV